MSVVYRQKWILHVFHLQSKRSFASLCGSHFFFAWSYFFGVWETTTLYEPRLLCRQKGEYTFFRSRWSFLDHWDPYSSVSVPRPEKCDYLSQWYWTQEYHFQRAKSKRNFAIEHLKENAFVIYCIRILAWRTTKVTQNFADVSSVSPSSERWRRANARTSSLQLFMVANFCYQLSW